MEIGGSDMVVDAENSEGLRELVREFFSEQWPAGVSDEQSDGRGVFFYEHEHARREWELDGPSPTCEDKMVEVLYGDQQMTIVSHHEGQTRQMALDLAEVIRKKRL